QYAMGAEGTTQPRSPTVTTNRAPRKEHTMQIIHNIPIFGEHEANTLEQARLCAQTADRFALMADGHLGYGVPIGGVIASESRISPTAVGYDIACGNKAVRLDMPGSELRANVQRIMDDIWTTLSFGVGRKNNERVQHPSVD